MPEACECQLLNQERSSQVFLPVLEDTHTNIARL